MTRSYFSLVLLAALAGSAATASLAAGVKVDAQSALRFIGSNGLPVLDLAEYRPDDSMTIVDLERPVVCLTGGEAIPPGERRVLLDGNALGGVSIAEPIRTTRLRYVPSDNVNQSILSILANGSRPTTCFVVDGTIPEATIEASTCAASPGLEEDDGIFPGGFEIPDKLDIKLTTFGRDPNNSDRLVYELEISPDEDARYSAHVSLREWFPADAEQYDSVLGGGYAQGEVSELKCTAFSASCDGAAEKYWTKDVPAVMTLKNAYIPEDGCIRLKGRRSISAGVGQQSAPLMIGIANYGTGDVNTLIWKSLPAEP